MNKAYLALEILATYVPVRVNMRGADIRQIVARLRAASPTAEPSEAELALALHLGRAVRRVLAFHPARSRCLVMSLVLTKMLARRGLSSSLVIGVAPGPDFAAHAWVETRAVPLLPPATALYAPLVRL